MSESCEPIVCCPPGVSDYLAGGGGMRQEGVLYNVDVAETGPTTKAGYAAIGIKDDDFWNTFTIALGHGALTLKDSTGKVTAVTCVAASAVWGWGNNGNTDPMVASFFQHETSSNTPMQLNNLPAGTYDLYVYGWSNAGGSSGGHALAAGEFFVTVNSVHYPVPSGSVFTESNPNPPPWTKGANFNRIAQIPVVAGQALIISLRGASWKPKISGFQLIRNPAPVAPGPGRGTVEPAINTGVPSFFEDGHSIIAGRYRMSYLRGAVKLAPSFVNWGIDSTLVPSIGYYIEHSGSVITRGPWASNLTTQAEVELAFAGSYVDFDHTGGTISIRLADAIYDNIPGSPNPTFALSRLD